jgi:hypothetical protein
VIALIDGREGLLSEISAASKPLRAYIASQLDGLSRHPDFDAGVEGALPMGPETRERAEQVVLPRINEIILLGHSPA